MNIEIIYRHVHKKHESRSRDPSKIRPSWFSYEICFYSILNSLFHSKNLEDLRFRLNVVYDGTSTELESDWIYEYLQRANQVRTYLVNGGSNAESWKYALSLGLINDEKHLASDIIYFVENDYFHRKEWALTVTEVANYLDNGHYLSLYDHADKYFYDSYKNLASKVMVSATCHWRTTPSSCGTFMAKRITIAEDLPVWLKMADHAAFISLSQTKNRQLITPIPGLNTHCMVGLISPCIDWAFETKKLLHTNLPKQFTWNGF